MLATERSQVTLRRLTVADAAAYFSAVEANKEHLSQFADETAAKYPDLQTVEESITHPTNPDKLRLGIWDGATFVGSINLTPDDEGRTAEIRYWLDERYTGHGYATLAAKALGNYARDRYEVVHADVVEGNTSSENVLLRSGFQKVRHDAGRIIFELSQLPDESERD